MCGWKIQMHCVAKTKEISLPWSALKLVCLCSEFHHSPACRLLCVCVDSTGWCTWRFSEAALGLVSITVVTLGDIRSRENEEAEEAECLLFPDLLHLSLWSAEVISYIPPLRSSKALEEIWHSLSVISKSDKFHTFPVFVNSDPHSTAIWFFTFERLWKQSGPKGKEQLLLHDSYFPPSLSISLSPALMFSLSLPLW